MAADFADLVLGPGAHRKLLRRHTPSFMYRLHDLGSVDSAALRGEIATRATLRVLQATGAGALEENLKELLDTLGALFHAQSATELFHALLNYIFKAGDSLDTKRVKALLDETPDPEYKEKIMSLAEQFKTEGEALGRREGEALGLRKGVAESSRQIIIQMLTRRFWIRARPYRGTPQRH